MPFGFCLDSQRKGTERKRKEEKRNEKNIEEKSESRRTRHPGVDALVARPPTWIFTLACFFDIIIKIYHGDDWYGIF